MFMTNALSTCVAPADTTDVCTHPSGSLWEFTHSVASVETRWGPCNGRVAQDETIERRERERPPDAGPLPDTLGRRVISVTEGLILTYKGAHRPHSREHMPQPPPPPPPPPRWSCAIGVLEFNRKPNFKPCWVHYLGRLIR
ncbi:unnamed protein product [Gadus morhua 'NCC']